MRKLGRWLVKKTPTVLDLIIVGVVGAVLAAAVIALPRLLDGNGSEDGSESVTSPHVATTENQVRDTTAERQTGSGGARDNGMTAANRRLSHFAGRRCSPVSRPVRAIAAVRCPVNGRSVVFTRFKTGREAVYYFNTESGRMPAFRGEAGFCDDWWISWVRRDKQTGGHFTLRGNARRTRILWTYRGHAVVVSATGRSNAAPQLCGMWESLLDLPIA